MQNKQEQIMLEETIYRRQLKRNHGVLGSKYIPKYDTGEPIC